ncbi:hypothetical protein G9A89_002423 [Geosiphon pyriformis]|nr:hypothetical protein G9A89_002423 [Geosiphon pyriformis]
MNVVYEGLLWQSVIVYLDNTNVYLPSFEAYLIYLKNNFKVVTTPNATTLKYYQSIYTHCKQRFNIPDGIEVVKKSVYQYIENHINNYLFGNYNISEVRSNLYNNLVHYSQLGTEDLNSETLATYFQELNFNIIKYCEKTYPVQSQYSIDFESETDTSNKGKQKLKQYSKTTPNIPILPKTTAKHLQTPEQGTSSKLLLTITLFLALLTQAQTPNSPLNRFARLEDFTSLRSPTRQQEPLQTINEENDSEIFEKESIDSENKEDKMTAYIAKIPEFNGEDIKTSLQEWLDQVTKAGDANGWNAARMLRTILYFLKRTADEWFENLTTPFNDWTAFKTAFLEQFTNNNTSITLQNHFHNIKQELSKSVMTYIGKFNKLFRRIRQLETNDYYSNAQILDQFIAGLKDKLIKKVCPHASEDLNSAIQHAKKYEMAMKEANRTKLVNLAIRETSSAAKKKLTNSQKKSKTISPTNNNSNPKDINYPKDRIKTTLYYPLITSLRIAITVEFLATGKEIAESYNEINKTGVINLTIHQDCNIKLTTINLLHSQCNNNIDNPFNITKYLLEDCSPKSSSTRFIHYYTQPSYLTIPEEQDFYHTALSEGRATARQQNSSYTPTTILPARIAENANLSDIFSFEFEANKSPFLLSNTTANKQKAITAMYTKAKIKKKTIHLILDNRSTGSIITYQLMQHSNSNHYCQWHKKDSTLVRNDWLQKANAKLDWKTQELQLFYQGQHARVSTTCGIFNKQSEKAPVFEFEEKEEKPVVKTFMALESTSNWAEETEQIETPFDATYNSALNKLYYYFHDVEMIFDLAMALVNGATKKNVHQMKKAEYIEYTIELAGFNYKDKLCEECIMFCNEQWCPECYAFSIFLPSENDENEIEFGEPEATEKIEATPIYLIKNQPSLQLKYFNNNGQGIKPEKAHEIDAKYDLRYPNKDTLVLKPKSLTKINLKIALEILPGAMIQIPITAQQIFESNEQICLEHNISIPNIYILEETKKVRVTFYNPNNYSIVLLNNIEIGVIHSNIFQQELPQTVPNFSEIIEHLLPKINPNPSSENYHVVIEKLSQINMGQLEPQQQN